MKYIINKQTSCEKCLDCSNIIRKKIEKKFNCKLMADNERDTVHGAIIIYHEKNNHKIIIKFYEKNETRKDQATLKKLSNIPTESEIKKII
tara:strand:+ start:446 stop:718 length:273 start_codon:yes stop_codon:yes gene_type:complete